MANTSFEIRLADNNDVKADKVVLFTVPFMNLKFTFSCLTANLRGTVYSIVNGSWVLQTVSVLKFYYRGDELRTYKTLRFGQYQKWLCWLIEQRGLSMANIPVAVILHDKSEY